MVTLDEYFARSDTPSKNSPVGKLMLRILAEFPEMDREEARNRASKALLGMGSVRRQILAYNRFLHALGAGKGPSKGKL